MPVCCYLGAYSLSLSRRLSLLETGSSNSPYALILSLRSHMQFLVDNFQYYLQADVLETQFQLLTKKMMTLKVRNCAPIRSQIRLCTRSFSVQDYDSIRAAHDDFLTNLSRLCFLNARVGFHLLHLHV